MAQPIEESLFQAIKKDDIKAFAALMQKARCGACRLGRFPVLSLMYLYKSRRLISEYGQSFLKNTNFEVLREPVEVSNTFSAKAGKCLRLYLNEVVSPLEMLLILDRIKQLKGIYPLTKPSADVKRRLKSIYWIKYSLNVKFEGDDIILDKRPLSYREKKKIATVCLSSVLAVCVAVGAPVTTVALIPKPVEGEVKKLSQIDFGAAKEYIIKRDIVLPENYQVEKVNCKITGEGHKLTLGKGATLGALSGHISDLTIESSGDAVFTTVSENATIKNVTVNVSADVTTTEQNALVAVTNYGTLDGVTVNISGKLSALSSSSETAGELNFGGIVQSNNYKYNTNGGTIKNCTVNFAQFELVGEASANASFGGIAGVNNGYLQDCTVTGEISGDTFDMAGVCAVNNGMLEDNVNEANLYQKSSDSGWNPIIGGIVISNTYAVENCENRGNIRAVSDCGQFEVQEDFEPTVSAAGIAYLSRGSSTSPYIKNCTNSGKVECKAEYRNVYAAGVCLSTSGGVDGCKNSGDVTAEAGNDCGTYAGGICTIAYANIDKCVNEGGISAAGSGTAYVGGISAHTRVIISNCLSSGDITVTAKDVYAGGILGFSEIVSYYYIYFGEVDYCISQSKIKVTATGETPAYVGGIAGYLPERRFNSVYGGSVTNSYFTGGFETENSYCGNIVGVCGANIYENNSYIAISGMTEMEFHNFEGNYYSGNGLTAFGKTISEDGSFTSVEDKGATSATIEDIKNSENYKLILSALKIEK
ncbi:MAG: hypothetical protein K2L12_03670 [Clostridia bacterium]|nr:hypothetical protein [Clostridia bacterium]